MTRPLAILAVLVLLGCATSTKPKVSTLMPVEATRQDTRKLSLLALQPATNITVTAIGVQHNPDGSFQFGFTINAYYTNKPIFWQVQKSHDLKLWSPYSQMWSTTGVVPLTWCSDESTNIPTFYRVGAYQ